MAEEEQCRQGSEGRVSEDGPGSAWWWWSNGQKLKHRKLHVNTRKNFFYIVGDEALEQSVQRVCVVSLTGEIAEQSGHDPVLCALEWPRLSRKLRPRWPHPCSNLTHSVILLFQGHGLFYCQKPAWAFMNGRLSSLLPPPFSPYWYIHILKTHTCIFLVNLEEEGLKMYYSLWAVWGLFIVLLLRQLYTDS